MAIHYETELTAIGGFGRASGTMDYPSPGPSSADGSFVSTSGTFTTSGNLHDADFGTLTVSENRDKSTSRLIHLPVIRIHAMSKDPGEPIFGQKIP